MNAIDILLSIINEFDIKKFTQFFREKNSRLRYPDEPLYYEENKDNFSSSIGRDLPMFEQGKKIAEGVLDDGELIVCSFLVNRELTERSGKKRQYDLGKRILKEHQADAGIFIFYDSQGNFRFSLIYTDYLGKNRNWSNFKRYTYFVSKKLTNKTFLRQIGEGDFSTLEKIKEAFSVDPVTKQFYNEIQNWYFWAMDKIKFPDDYKYSTDPAKDVEIRNATNLIRLVTRIIFIWFLKEKDLVPSDLFSKEKLIKIVKNFMKDKDASNFYNAILQNLFFATLNQEINQRKFAENKGFPANQKEYGVKNLYRYEDKFLITKDEVLKLFNDIPFLNGGLFDCLDKEDETGKVIYIDGFSRNPSKETFISDYLFYQHQEEKVDLSKYGLGSKKPVRGLIEILNSYNFTIDENTPIDQEIALDPELLGKVFENLLASYNPETSTTARKATGSYYTPREIVDFMVEESLFEYLKEKLPEADEEKIKILLSYSEEIPVFSEEEKQKIISTIDNIKILDPACGSGAFPMGVLHKLVHTLQKLDPENEFWYELQYQKALKESEEVFKQDDKIQREEMLKEINDAFDEGMNYPDYARKLYLIENCIYGVDIQPIAIQISKLRFFISLVLDQKVDRSKENFGIRALPNLETKFVAANTLIGLEKPSQMVLPTINIIKLESEIRNLRHKYFQAKTRSEKLRHQKKDKELRRLLAGELETIGFSIESSEKIAKFDLYDQNASADFFDPELMFGIKDGFDIVIGNPPYGNIMDKQKNGESHTKGFVGKYYLNSTISDISSPFVEKGVELLMNKGNLFYIITYAITFNKNFSENRQQIANSFKKTKIYTFDRDKCRIFKSMSQSVSILMCISKNTNERLGIFTSRMFRETPDLNSIKLANCDHYLFPRGAKYYDSHRLPKLGEKINVQILNKLLSNKLMINSLFKRDGERVWIRTSGNYWYNAFDKRPYNSVDISSLFFDRNYVNFIILLINSSLFYFWFRVYGDGRHMNIDILENFPLPDIEKILTYNILLDKVKERFMNKLFSVFEEERKRFITSNIKSEIDLLDLILGKYLYNLTYNEINHILNYDSEVRGGNKLEKPFINLIDKIIAVIKDEDYLDNTAKKAKVQEYKQQIDQMVYNLYDLTYDEIKIVEGK